MILIAMMTLSSSSNSEVSRIENLVSIDGLQSIIFTSGYSYYGPQISKNDSMFEDIKRPVKYIANSNERCRVGGFANFADVYNMKVGRRFSCGKEYFTIEKCYFEIYGKCERSLISVIFISAKKLSNGKASDFFYVYDRNKGIIFIGMYSYESKMYEQRAFIRKDY